MDEGYEIRDPFLVISKSLDKVGHKDPDFKSKENGIFGNLLNILEDFLKNSCS